MNQISKKPFPVSNESVLRILNLRESKEFLKKRLEAVEDELKAAESDIVQSIELGAANESEFALLIKTQERRYPSWKEHFVDMLGKDAADRILDQTKPTVYKNLSIKPGKAA